MGEQTTELQKLQSENAELLRVVKALRSELFLKLWNQHSAKFASEYPEIVEADAIIKKVEGK